MKRDHRISFESNVDKYTQTMYFAVSFNCLGENIFGRKIHVDINIVVKGLSM